MASNAYQWHHLGMERRTAPGDTLQGLTPEGEKIVGKFTKIVEKRGRTGKKSVGWHPPGGWHPSEIKVTVMSKKRSSVFQEKINRSDTAELTDGDK